MALSLTLQGCSFLDFLDTLIKSSTAGSATTAANPNHHEEGGPLSPPGRAAPGPGFLPQTFIPAGIFPPSGMGTGFNPGYGAYSGGSPGSSAGGFCYQVEPGASAASAGAASQGTVAGVRETPLPGRDV